MKLPSLLQQVPRAVAAAAEPAVRHAERPQAGLGRHLHAPPPLRRASQVQVPGGHAQQPQRQRIPG